MEKPWRNSGIYFSNAHWEFFESAFFFRKKKRGISSYTSHFPVGQKSHKLDCFNISIVSLCQLLHKIESNLRLLPMSLASQICLLRKTHQWFSFVFSGVLEEISTINKVMDGWIGAIGHLLFVNFFLFTYIQLKRRKLNFQWDDNGVEINLILFAQYEMACVAV